MRSIPHKESKEIIFPWSPPGTFRTETHDVNYSDDLITSSSHPGWRTANWKEDRGGPFEVVKREYLLPPFVDGDWPDHYGQTVNGFKKDATSSLNNGFPSAASIGDAELRGLGTLAISLLAPTAPRYQLLSFLGELREGLPKVVGFASRKGNIAQRISSENLNYQFGIVPALSDVQSLVEVTRNASDLWAKYAANSGRLRRRRLQFDPTLESSYSSPKKSIIPPHPSLGVHYGERSTFTRTFRRIWFSGAFIYYVPTDPWKAEASRLHYLYGVGAQSVPASAWALTPYSWLADWVANTSKILTNLDAFASDSLVMPYGYICEETVEQKTVQWDLDIPGFPNRIYFGYQTTRKKRIQASPYGFDVDWPNLSARRLGILGSLGVTRASR